MTHLPTAPDDDQITITVRRSHLAVFVGGMAVYAELTLVQHLAPFPAAVFAALTLTLSLLHRS